MKHSKTIVNIVNFNRFGGVDCSSGRFICPPRIRQGFDSQSGPIRLDAGRSHRSFEMTRVHTGGVAPTYAAVETAPKGPWPKFN